MVRQGSIFFFNQILRYGIGEGNSIRWLTSEDLEIEFGPKVAQVFQEGKKKKISSFFIEND